MKIINNLPQLLDVQRQLDNIDFLLGTHDISHIGDETVTGTICSLNEKLSGKSDTGHNHDSRYLQKTAVINNTTATEAGYALDARQANPNISGSLGAQITSLNETLTTQISELNTNLTPSEITTSGKPKHEYISNDGIICTIGRLCIFSINTNLSGTFPESVSSIYDIIFDLPRPIDEHLYWGTFYSNGQPVRVTINANGTIQIYRPKIAVQGELTGTLVYVVKK